MKTIGGDQASPGLLFGPTQLAGSRIRTGSALSSIFDGLQSPLEEVADASGLFFCPEGIYFADRLNRKKHWDYAPEAKAGQVIDARRHTGVNDFRGQVPPSHHGALLSITAAITLTWVITAGRLSWVDTVIAKAKDAQGN